MTLLLWAASALAACGVAYAMARPLLKSDPKSGVAVLAVVPLATLGLYLYLGNPSLPDAPLAPRLDGALEDLPPAAILARLENELRARPDDAQGWRLLARLRATLGDHPRAADAWQRLLDLLPGDVEAEVGLALSLIEQDDGVVSAAALNLLDRALAAEPDNQAAQFWRGEAAVQQGDVVAAKRLWGQLRKGLPDDAPLAVMLDRRLAE